MDHEIVVGEHYFCNSTGWTVDGSIIEVTAVGESFISFTVITPSAIAESKGRNAGYKGLLPKRSNTGQQLQLIENEEKIEEEIVICPGFNDLFGGS